MSVIVKPYKVDDLAYARNPETEQLADTTIKFAVGSTAYEIDLSEKNADKFRRNLAPYTRAARRLNGGRSRPAASRRRSVEIREWARGARIAVSDRGRIPAAVVEQYERAQGLRA